jgi:hypothetical protein
MEHIIAAILDLYPDVDPSTITEQTRLSQIPGWDSMNAINFVMKLQELSGCYTLKLTFSPSLTAGQVLEALRARGVQV